jgi:hypothetical protein
MSVMSGSAGVVASGDLLVRAVAEVALRLGLAPRLDVRVGRRIWGAERHIDVVLTYSGNTRQLGIECLLQGAVVTAEERIPAIVQDLAAWPIPGIVVFSGDGFSPNMWSFLIASGKAVELGDLEVWLRLYFALDLD